MPVQLREKTPDELLPIKGVQLYTAQAGIKKPNHTDLTLIQLSPNSTIGAVFTQNRFCAAPVLLAKQHLSHENGIHALIINTGNANAGTGAQGREHAWQMCQAVAKQLHCEPNQVLPFSTGVILEPLPIEKIVRSLPEIKPANWAEAARAIMTTDTLPKAAHQSAKIGHHHTINATGIAKGSGMICPNMATMLAFIATDAKLSQPIAQQLTEEIVQETFNCITVDGDTSTNDSFVIIATGQSEQNEIDNIADPRYQQIKTLLMSVALELAQAIVRDGEGASKFITININNAATRETAKKVAYAIAHSPLVKTAFSASDPNLGRILSAIGYSGANIDVEAIEVYLGDVLVVQNGGRAVSYTEEQGQRIMNKDEITIRVDLRQGKESHTLYTCDLTKEYVSINADYRS